MTKISVKRTQVKIELTPEQLVKRKEVYYMLLTSLNTIRYCIAEIDINTLRHEHKSMFKNMQAQTQYLLDKQGNMTKVTAIINKITTEDKEVNIKIVGNFVPWSYGHRDKFGAPEEPDEPAHFDILETSIDDINYDDDDLAILLGMSLDDVSIMLDEALGEAYEGYLEDAREADAENRIDNMKFFDDLDDNW